MTSKARQLGWWRRAPGLRLGWPGSWPHPPPCPPLPILLTLDGGDVFYGRQLLRPFLKSASVIWGGEGLLWPLGESPPLTLPGARGPHFLFLKQPRQAAPLPRPQPPASSCPPTPRGSLLGSGAPTSTSLPAARFVPCWHIRKQTKGRRVTLLLPLMWAQNPPNPAHSPTQHSHWAGEGATSAWPAGARSGPGSSRPAPDPTWALHSPESACGLPSSCPGGAAGTVQGETALCRHTA